MGIFTEEKIEDPINFWKVNSTQSNSESEINTKCLSDYIC